MSIQLLASTYINLCRKQWDLGRVLFQIYSDKNTPDIQYIVIIKGEVCNNENVITRIHSECITGDLFGSDKCDCGEQLDNAYESISKSRSGIIIWIKGHEGRGIGLVEKIKAYNLQETQKLDTVEANIALGHKIDLRNFSPINLILESIRVKSISIITNNPCKIESIKYISRIIHTKPNTTKNNLEYLQTKIEKLGHKIDLSADNSAEPTRRALSERLSDC